MKEILKTLQKIRKELGGELCEVEARTTEFGLTLQVNWYDGSDFHVRRDFTETEITNIIDDSIIVDHFTKWAKETKDHSNEQVNRPEKAI